MNWHLSVWILNQKLLFNNTRRYIDEKDFSGEVYKKHGR